MRSVLTSSGIFFYWACSYNILWRTLQGDLNRMPRQMMGKKEFGEKGVTAGFMARVTKDSGLCVLEGLISMVDKGVLGLAIIKKRRYWPEGFPAEEIL